MEEKQEIRIRDVTRQLEEKKDLLRIKEKVCDRVFLCQMCIIILT